jgi:ribonucleotide reductase beta subunit family protein with ferritin-like domain
METLKIMGDPILDPSLRRYCLLPIEHHDIWELYKRHASQVWFAEDINLEEDATDYNGLLEKERRALDEINGFFFFSDAIVIENCGCNFIGDVQLPESIAFYSYQIFDECIHNETYALIIDATVRDQRRKKSIFEGLQHNTHLQMMVRWAQKWMDASLPFATRLVAFVVYEGLIFSSKFAFVFSFKARNKLPGMCKANMFIMRDEAAHEEHGILLHSKLQSKCTPEAIQSIVSEAVDADDIFMRHVLPENILGLNAQLMSEYTRLVANRLLQRLGAQPLYDIPPQNPIMSMMQSLGLDNKVSFFENRNHVYQRTNVIAGLKGNPFDFEITDDY